MREQRYTLTYKHILEAEEIAHCSCESQIVLFCCTRFAPCDLQLVNFFLSDVGIVITLSLEGFNAERTVLLSL